MGWQAANVTTQDNYVDATIPGAPTLDRIRADRITLRVNNAAIYLERRRPIFGVNNDGDWGNEILFLPGYYVLQRANTTGIRARSAVGALPALITLEAFGDGD